MVAALVPAVLLSTDAHAAEARERSLRGQLVHRIVAKWGNHVQEAHRADVRRWAMDMVPIFSKASLDTLSNAASARSFQAMNDALLVDRKGMGVDARLSIGSTNKVLATSGKALGDAAADLVYVPVTPCRIIDTRVAGGVIPANSVRDFDVTTAVTYAAQGGDATDCGIGSAGDFAAAVINFTVVTPNVAGYMTAFPYQGTRPLASTLNYVAGDIRGNLAIVKLDQGNAAPELSVYTFAQTHLVADVTGYFINPQATNLNCVNTSVSSFTIAANSTDIVNNPACPAGYSATTPYCWTATPGVYSQGSGYNANSSSNLTFCAWQNTTAANQTTFGGNVCCRVPGR